MKDHYYTPDRMPEITIIYSIVWGEIEIQELFINDKPVSPELNELILGEWGDDFEEEIYRRNNEFSKK